jgi:hypothetical protein
MDETTLDCEIEVVSQTGTRHVTAATIADRHRGTRITTLCGYGVPVDLDGVEAVRDCEFCQVELEKIRKRTEDARPAPGEESKVVAIDETPWDSEAGEL